MANCRERKEKEEIINAGEEKDLKQKKTKTNITKKMSSIRGRRM